ncbi:MAG: hypothetical protein Q4F71_10355, partial [Paracoccus sp. (in: a-proteobacteria)]|nr:hypothetical protein [Paracoccus sp. (in: a-proteobacteria)]
MVNKHRELARLRALAELRKNRELARFADVQTGFAAIQGQIDRAAAQMRDLFQSETPFSLEEGRLANLLAQRLTLEARHAMAAQRELRPAFEAARARAIAEFGRAKVLDEISARNERAAAR